ncbi:MAG: UvrD-helicase domain-containing protein [Bacteroidota bacterium]
MLHLIRASAGAGKTHRLVYIYLQHILATPTHIPDIIVLSFTNKATQELKARILTHLHDLAAEKMTSMAIDLQKSLDCDRATLTEQARQALDYLLKRYDHLAVHTIDAFFQDLLRTFTYELNIPSNYQLLLEQDQLLSHCLTELLQQLPQNPGLQKTLTELALQKIEQGKTWHFNEEIKKWGYDLLATWQDPSSPNDLVEQDTSPKALSVLPKLYQRSSIFRDNMRLKAKNILYHIKKEQLEAKDFAWGEKGIIGFLEKVANKKKISPPSTRTLQASLDSSVWVSKKSPRRDEILALVEETLQPLLTTLLALYTDEYAHYTTSQTLLSLRHRLLTTQKMAKLIQQYAHTHETVLIHNLPQYIRKIVAEDHAPFLYAKTGRKPQHFLIDESQDLSTAQWYGLAPFIRELVSQQKKNYLVGDAKQAIYRWRGGNPQLLLQQIEEEIDSQNVEKTNLPYNWRSRPAIVHFNNAFFYKAAQLMTTYLQEQIFPDNNVNLPALKKEIAQIQQVYAHTKQKVASIHNGSVQGYVHVSFISSNTGSNQWKDIAIQRTIQTIETLQETGYSLNDITLLVRNHTEVRILLEALLKHAKSNQAKQHLRYDAIANSALSLSEDLHISLLLTVLRSLQHPNDPVIYAALQHGLKHYAPTFKLPSETLQTVRSYPCLTTQVYELIQRLGLQERASEAHLNAFKEIVYTFSLQRENSLSDFLRWWDEYGCQQSAPIPSNKEALKIMTIHQSKGLTFKAVILPFCHWHLDHIPSHPPMIWGDSEEEPFHELGKVPLTYTSQLQDTYYATSYFQEKWQQYLEQLNLLYVAFTRASNLFYVFTPYKPSKKLTTTSNLLTQLLITPQDPENPLQQEGKWDSTTLTWEAGVLTSPVQARTQSTQPLHPKRDPVPTEPTLFKKILRHVQQPHHKGIWWHELLSQIITLDDVVPLLYRYVKKQRINQRQAKYLQTYFKELFQNEQLRYWFSSDWEVHTERTVMLPSGELWRPDRIMIQKKKAIVLDYKMAKHLPEHHEQVRIYLNMMTQLGYESVQGYLLYLHRKKLIPVIPSKTDMSHK